MKTVLTPLTVFCLLLAFSGCSVTVTAFRVPQLVSAGQVFEVLVLGDGTGPSGSAGAVLQLPNGFVVEGADGYLGTSTGLLNFPVANGGTRNDPGLLATMAAEPGHHLVSFHHRDPTLQYPPPLALRVYVRAPQTAAGTFVLKVVAAGTDGSGPFQVLSPAGVTSFANVTSAPWVQTCTVGTAPTTPFVVEATGLLRNGAVGAPSSGVACGDIDGDGDDDVVLPILQGAQAGAAIYRSGPGPAWSLQDFRPGTTYGLSAAFGDFDGDGHLDIVDDSGAVRFGDGGTSWVAGPVLPLPGRGVVTTGDVDGDHVTDIAFASIENTSVRVYRSLGNRTFTSWSGNLPNGTSSTLPVRSRIVLRDVTRDGHCDVLTLDSLPGGTGLQVWAGNGLGNWMALPGHIGVTAFAVGDFDRDGLTDVVVSIPNALAVLRFVNGAFQATNLPLPPGTPPAARDLLLMDHDRDGFEDVVFAGIAAYWGPTPPPAAARVLLLPNLAAASLGPMVELMPSAPAVNMGWGCFGLATGDFDGDTWPDLAAVLPYEQPRIWRNTDGGSAPFGHACGAAGHATPLCDTVGQLQLGSANFAFRLGNANPQQLALLWVGLSRRFHAGVPILPYELTPHGAPGCAVFAANDALLFAIADGNGEARLPIQIPNHPALHLTTLFFQGAVMAPGANALGMLFANAVAARIP